MISTKVYANMLSATNSGRMDAERLRRIAESKTVADAFKVLGDYGYAYSEGLSVDGFIVGETDRLIEFVTDTATSGSLSDALTARFKYNNAKLAYKSRFTSVPSDGYYNAGLDVQKIADGDYEDVDPFMAAALEALDEQNETRPQQIDLALTRAMYKYVLSFKSALIKKYFRAEIDMKNILSVARMKKLGLKDAQFIEGGRISLEILEEAVAEDDFAGYFEHTPYAEYAERIEQGEFKDLWKAEQEADDFLYFMTHRDVVSYSSDLPFLNYYTETLIELKTVKTALVCVKTDSRDMFYKRMPEIYKQ